MTRAFLKTSVAVLVLAAAPASAQLLGQYDPAGQSRTANTPNDGQYYGAMAPPGRPAGNTQASQVVTVHPNSAPLPVGNGNPVAGANTIGSYSMAATSGTIAAGLAAASPVFSYRYTGQNLAVVRRVDLSAGASATAFTAGFGGCQLFVARTFTAVDTGGTSSTITGNNGKLRTSLPPTAVGNFQIANTGTLSAGTRTLDSTPVAAVSFGVLATAGTTLYSGTPFDMRVTQSPVVLANNEGIVMQCTVPATGTWQMSVQVMWDEVNAF